jgi:hypothetical protein
MLRRLPCGDENLIAGCGAAQCVMDRHLPTRAPHLPGTTAEADRASIRSDNRETQARLSPSIARHTGRLHERSNPLS